MYVCLLILYNNDKISLVHNVIIDIHGMCFICDLKLVINTIVVCALAPREGGGGEQWSVYYTSPKVL